MWERIEALMKERNLRMADVARGSGVSYSTLTDWKSGRYVPKRDKIEKIANYFNVLPDYLEGKIDRKEKINVIVNNHDPQNKKPIAEIVENISQMVYEKFIKEHPEYLDDTEEDKATNILSPYDRSDVEKAMTLFHQYEQAPPEIQSAIETLLKASQPET